VGFSEPTQDPISSDKVGIATIDKSWTKDFTLHKVPGDGECFFSSVNYLMKEIDKNWKRDNISLRAATLQQYEKNFVQFFLTSNTETAQAIQQRCNVKKARF